MKTIALCFNTPGMDRAEWTDPGYGKRFPGAGFLKWLPVLNTDPNTSIIDGMTCLHHDNGLDPKEVIVVQEENNPCGQDLVKMGADPRVLICLESPIYASSFYDNIPTHFKHRLLFYGGSEHINFPSFDDSDIQEPTPWMRRKFLCMVTANKHYSMLRKTDSPSFKRAMETQLHDYRYAAIHYFIRREGFDLYGNGWPSYVIECDKAIKPCDDKLETIRNYKFALCFENGSYPGYITEKIIDCLVAGVIPVYMGAQDIDNYIPRNFYIDARNFKSFEDMELFLRDNNGLDPEVRIKASQQWVKNSKYNNRFFAKHILELCE